MHTYIHACIHAYAFTYSACNIDVRSWVHHHHPNPIFTATISRKHLILKTPRALTQNLECGSHQLAPFLAVVAIRSDLGSNYFRRGSSVRGQRERGQLFGVFLGCCGGCVRGTVALFLERAGEGGGTSTVRLRFLLFYRFFSYFVLWFFIFIFIFRLFFPIFGLSVFLGVITCSPTYFFVKHDFSQYSQYSISRNNHNNNSTKTQRVGIIFEGHSFIYNSSSFFVFPFSVISAFVFQSVFKILFLMLTCTYANICMNVCMCVWLYVCVYVQALFFLMHAHTHIYLRRPLPKQKDECVCHNC